MNNTAVAEAGAQSSPAPLVTARDLLPYAFFVGLLLTILIYFVGAEEGALSMFGGTTIHEFVHDPRHLLGFPCH